MFGGRNWTIVSALLLLVPTLLLAVAVQDPTTPFWALLPGRGDRRRRRRQLRLVDGQHQLLLPAAREGRGARPQRRRRQPRAVRRCSSPCRSSSSVARRRHPRRSRGRICVPLLLVAAYAYAGLRCCMDNLVRREGRPPPYGVAALRSEAAHWIMSFLYIGTFGSFIGFSGAFPMLIADQFPASRPPRSAPASISLAFLGALRRLARPAARRLAGRPLRRRAGDHRRVRRHGAHRRSRCCAIVLPRAGQRSGRFLGFFLLLFVATGVGNGSVYRMIPASSGLGGASDAARGAATSARPAARPPPPRRSPVRSAPFGGFLDPAGVRASSTTR